MSIKFTFQRCEYHMCIDICFRWQMLANHIALGWRSIIKSYSVRLHIEDFSRTLMLLLWQLLIEMLCSSNWRSYKKICKRILEEFAIFVFDAYYINVSVSFHNSERKKSPIHVPIIDKIHRLESAQCAFLDHSKTLGFSDKIEILFKYLCARTICTYSSHAKKAI